MNSCTVTPAAYTRGERNVVQPVASSSRRWLDRLIGAWKEHRRASAERRLDSWFAANREERERYLGRAGDVYELERLEREFERRDTWRGL